MTSSPVKRTALRAEVNRLVPPSQQVSANPVIGPTPVQPLGEDLGAEQVPGNVHQLPTDRLQLPLQRLEHVHGGGDLDLPGGRQLLRGDLGQTPPVLLGADAAQPFGSLVDRTAWTR